MVKYLLDGCIADMTYQLESTKPRKRVGRVECDAQERERVFDVCGFGELDAAEFTEGNSVFAKFYFKIERVQAGAKEHCDFVKRHALCAQLFDALRDET